MLNLNEIQNNISVLMGKKPNVGTDYGQKLARKPETNTVLASH